MNPELRTQLLPPPSIDPIGSDIVTRHIPTTSFPQQAFHGSEKRSNNFKNFADLYEVNSVFAERLKNLDGYDIVVICDDSGSMNNELHDVQGTYHNPPTRWDELKRTLSVVIDLAATLDPDGIDIHFLNRKPIRNVRSSRQLEETFAEPPSGPTPIVPTLRRVIQEKQEQIRNGKLLIVIATDGEPTDIDGNPDIEGLRHVLLNERRPIEHVPVSVVACTDDHQTMAYLNDWDKNIPNLDVIDDYKAEYDQIRQCQGPSFPFSYGDYVVKAIMGAIDSWFDGLDEKRNSSDIRKS